MAAERKNRLAIARAGIDAIKKDTALRAQKHQGQKSNIELHEKIAILLAQDQSVRSIARELTASANTLMKNNKIQVN